LLKFVHVVVIALVIEGGVAPTCANHNLSFEGLSTLVAQCQIKRFKAYHMCSILVAFLLNDRAKVGLSHEKPKDKN
jgi:hypothetical protein